MLKAARKFARIPIVITCLIVAILGSLSAGDVTLKTGFSLIVIVLLVIHGNSINDLADYDIDKINLKDAKDRPLVTKDITVRSLWILHVACGVLAIGLSLLYGTVAAAVTVAVILYNYAYSFRPFRITDRTILSPLTLAATYAYQPFTLGYAAVRQPPAYSWLLATAIYFGFIARILLKDFRDVSGDARFGKQTFLIHYGASLTCAASGLFAIASFVLICLAINFSVGAVVALLVGNIDVLWQLTKLARAKEIKQQLKLIKVIAAIGNTAILTVLVYYLTSKYTTERFWIICLPLVAGLGLVLVVAWKNASPVFRFSSPSFFEHLIWLPVRVFLTVCGSLKIKGTENLRNVPTQVIVASNHATELDPLIIVSCLPFLSNLLPLIYVVRDKKFYKSNWQGLRRMFYGGNFFKIIGGYEAFSGLNNYEHALSNHLQAIEQGLSVCIFPVGRMHDSDGHQEAKGGVAYLAAKTGLPIVPVHIKGVDRQTTFWDYLARKPKLTISFGEPIYAQDIFDVALQTINQKSKVACEKAAVKVMANIAKL